MSILAFVIAGFILRSVLNDFRLSFGANGFFSGFNFSSLGRWLMFALLGLIAVGVVGIFVPFSGFNFSSLGSWFLFALLGLIAVGVVGTFVPFSRGVNIVYSLIGMAVFAGVFLFDLLHAKHWPNTWESIIFVTMPSYLMFINFLLYLLRFLEAISGKKR